MKLLSQYDIDLGSLVLSEEQLASRSPGLHVSSIINHISTTLGRRDNDFTEAELNRFATIGRLWEAQLAQALFRPPRYERIGELEKDGIVGSPDALDLEDLAVMEFKVTWKSAKRPIESFREFWWQQMAYCAMTGFERSRLYVFYVCGNYAPPVPFAKAYNAAFTAQELRANWDMLCREGKAVAR